MRIEKYLNISFCASSLPIVLFLSVFVLIIIITSYSMLSFDFKISAEYHKDKQEHKNLVSAITLYCNDSTLLENEDSSKICLFESTEREITLFRKPWGLYEIVTASNEKPAKVSRLVGKRYECPYKAALWLCDRKRALSLSGQSRIEKGMVYIPLNGINYTNIHGTYYMGKEINKERLRFSGEELPEIEPKILSLAENIIKGELKKEVILDKHTCIRDTIINARKARVLKNFRGAVQLFCTDTVILEKGAKLDYPSGIFIYGKQSEPYPYPYVIMEEGSSIEGYIIILNTPTDLNLSYPCFRQRKGTKLKGLLYADGACNIDGCIEGAAYIKDCFHEKEGEKFPGVLYMSHIVRSEMLPFPVFMKGSFTRSEIKIWNK